MLYFKGTKRKSNSLSTNQIENLTDGIQIFDAISNASDPFHVQVSCPYKSGFVQNLKTNIQGLECP
jgi:hypothetical protein